MGAKRKQSHDLYNQLIGLYAEERKCSHWILTYIDLDDWGKAAVEAADRNIVWGEIDKVKAELDKLQQSWFEKRRIVP